MKLLTPAQFAKKREINKTTVYRWIESENIEVVWIEKKVPMIKENATPKHENVKSN